MKGKAIYKPVGRAGEYATWACNLHVGCSNGCSYCYCRRGVLGSVMGGSRAVLKKCFKNVEDAFMCFTKELMKNADAIRADGGLFFSFSTDPCLPETIDLTFMCVSVATGAGVPCKILTKCAGWVLAESEEYRFVLKVRDLVTVGFTLTGCDELEGNASPNADRVAAMRKLHEAGVKTFASVEPVVDFDRATDMVRRTVGFCDEFKIGLLSGDRSAYDRYESLPKRVVQFVCDVMEATDYTRSAKVFWKKSVEDVLLEAGVDTGGVRLVNKP